MSSLQSDDTRYVKLWLLLVKGGTYVFKKHTQMILDNDNTSIDICLKRHRDQLFKKKEIFPKLWELCSNSGQPNDIDVLDISAHAYVLLNIFDNKLKAVEKVGITKLRDKRNELVHLVDRSLPEEHFLGEWSRLIMVLFQLSNGLSSNDQDYVNKLIDDISAIQHLDKAIDDLKPFENQDDFVKDILAKQQCIYERRKKYIFRYEYLLIKIGTEMLRRVFNHIVGPDLNVYLDNNPVRKRDFNKLLHSKECKLTREQRQLLPPIENSPSSDKFDITLLSYLLRNSCGLCSSSDPVWSKPQSTDTRLEADIARLRICRNELAHSGSVLEDDTVLKTKWSYLCLILQSLSSKCGFSGVNDLIQSAENVEFDEKLQEKFEEEKKEWLRGVETGIIEVKADIVSVKMDIGEVKVDISKVNTAIGGVERKLENLEELQSKKRHCDEDKTAVQKILIDAYQNDICSSLPLCPLLEDETEDTLKMYQRPTMYVVNYHKVEKQQTDKSSDNLKEVKTCADLFHVKDKDCNNIYLTGDAGVGKTSFCKVLSLLWCKSKSTYVRNTSFCIFFSMLCYKSKVGEELEKDDMQEYIDYLDKFEFVFYVNLRDTDSTDVVSIIVNQLFYSENKDKSNKMYDIVEKILGNHDSLVIMDGLDEWTPAPTDKRRYDIPVRPKSLKCVYLTTCRPYIIENVRLSETNLDHQVKMTGLGKLEIESYVSNLINIINTKYNENKNYKEFMMAVKQAKLVDMLHIPMTTSHLVMLWFDRPLTSMPKSLIYGNIMDMLFKLAHKKGIVIQQSKPSKLKLPNRLSELKHFKDHFSQIEQLCMLSFKLLFVHDTDITSLVFTRDQLASDTYCLSEVETNLFCTIGILSKNKVKRKLGKQEHKLSFLHKSYLEFFAAIYVSTLETSDVLEVFSQYRTINDVLKYEKFLIFYAGLSIENFVSLMTRIYSLISRDLDLTRALSIFSTNDDTMENRIKLLSLQDLILKCNIKESSHIENSLPLEDFIFDSYPFTETETMYLRRLILSNSKGVRLLRSETGEYFDEFETLDNLQVLYIDESDNKYNREFNELIKRNKLSLQIISILVQFNTPLLLPLPLEYLHYLTSLSLTNIKMSHENIHYLTKFLSDNSQLKHVRLYRVRCTDHDRMYNDVCGSFELVQCINFVYLEMKDTNIVCTNINTLSLEYIELNPCSKSTARSYMNIFNSIQYALELKHLDINGNVMLDDYLAETLITNVQYLSKIESIKLRYIIIRDNVSVLLHPSVKQVSINLDHVNMTARWFQTFIESVIDKHCCIKLTLIKCIIRQDDGDTKGNMSKKESGDDLCEYVKSTTESCDYIHDCIKSISAIKKAAVEITRGYNTSESCHTVKCVINDHQQNTYS